MRNIFKNIGGGIFIVAICCLMIYATNSSNACETKKQPLIPLETSNTEEKTFTPQLEAKITLTVLEKAESYYSTRFNILLGILVVGYGVPTWSIWYTRRESKKELEAIAGSIEKQKDHFQKQIDAKISIVDSKVSEITDKAISELRGKQATLANDFYSEMAIANSSLTSLFVVGEEYALAFTTALAAAEYTIKSSSFDVASSLGPLNIALGQLSVLKESDPQIKNSFNAASPMIRNLEKVISDCIDEDNQQKFLDVINKIKSGILRLKEAYGI